MTRSLAIDGPGRAWPEVRSVPGATDKEDERERARSKRRSADARLALRARGGDEDDALLDQIALTVTDLIVKGDDHNKPDRLDRVRSKIRDYVATLQDTGAEVV